MQFWDYVKSRIGALASVPEGRRDKAFKARCEAFALLEVLLQLYRAPHIMSVDMRGNPMGTLAKKCYIEVCPWLHAQTSRVPSVNTQCLRPYGLAEERWPSEPSSYRLAPFGICCCLIFVECHLAALSTLRQGGGGGGQTSAEGAEANLCTWLHCKFGLGIAGVT